MIIMEKVHDIEKKRVSYNRKADEFQKKVLLGLKEEYESIKKACVFNESDFENEVDSLSVLYSDLGEDACEVLGEFCFLPMRYDERYCIFNIIFSITEDVDIEYYDDLSRVVEKMNFNLPMGAFILDDKECILAYKHTCIVKYEDGVEVVVDYIKNILAFLKKVVEENVSILTRVERGEMSFEQFVLK